MNRPDSDSRSFPHPDSTGAAPSVPESAGANLADRTSQKSLGDDECSARRALNAAEFERVLARADELEALGRGSRARQLRAEVREGLIGQMLADPTHSSAARWLGLLLRVDPEAAEAFERRARQGSLTGQRSSTSSVPDPASAEAPRLGSGGVPARSLPLGAPLQRCGLRLRLDGLGELGLAACEGLQWAPAAPSSASPGARFEPGLWLAHEGPRDFCLPLGPGSFAALDDRGETVGAPGESVELRDALRFRWTVPGAGAPRTLSVQRWGAVWLLSITRGADLAGVRRLAWWPGPGRLRLDPADARLPLHALVGPMDLELDATQLRLASSGGLRLPASYGVSRGPIGRGDVERSGEVALDLPLNEPLALAVGGRTWLRVEPWEELP